MPINKVLEWCTRPCEADVGQESQATSSVSLALYWGRQRASGTLQVRGGLSLEGGSVLWELSAGSGALSVDQRELPEGRMSWVKTLHRQGEDYIMFYSTMTSLRNREWEEERKFTLAPLTYLWANIQHRIWHTCVKRLTSTNSEVLAILPMTRKGFLFIPRD